MLNDKIINMSDFNQLANLYFTKKKKNFFKPKTILLNQSNNVVNDAFKKDFESMVRSIFNVLKNINEYSNDIFTDKIGFINKFYKDYNASIPNNSLIIDNVSKINDEYFNNLILYLKSLNPEFSFLIKFYLTKTKLEFSTEKLDIIIFFLLIVQYSDNFQKYIHQHDKSFNTFS